MSLPVIRSYGLLAGLCPALLILTAGVAPWELPLAGLCGDELCYYVKGWAILPVLALFLQCFRSAVHLSETVTLERWSKSIQV